MLDKIPSEILAQILAHSAAASTIINVSRVNRKLYLTVSAGDYAIFKDFLYNVFPSIKMPPMWVAMAQSLTSRSKAWDKRSFIARECYPITADETQTQARRQGTQQTFGYIPVIDSYDEWSAQAGYRQVLAFGAAGRLRLRVRERRRTEWKSYCSQDDALAQNDIEHLRLLRPHQHENNNGESIIIRRVNGELCRVESRDGEDELVQTTKYMLNGPRGVSHMDVSLDRDPILAVCNLKSLQLFPASADSPTVQPTAILFLDQDFPQKHWKRCLSFLDDHTIAMGVQFVEASEPAPIMVYDVRPSDIVKTRLQPMTSLIPEQAVQGRFSANVITPLDATHSLVGRPGQVFLSGWTDGVARLYDLRDPSHVVTQYTDPVDDGQILSLAVVGHEKFFAGSHQNACLKFFDMRMPGARVYSHVNALPQSDQKMKNGRHKVTQKTPSRPTRDINIFLALTVRHDRLWSPLPRPQNNGIFPRYRGSIYSLSVPSATSPTLFAGIQNHIIQLDFANTGDILHNKSDMPDIWRPKLAGPPAVDDVLSLSCYERPRKGFEATDAVLLRKQIDWNDTVRGIDDNIAGPPEVGWDQRWRLPQAWTGVGVRAGRGGGGNRGRGSGRGSGGGRWRARHQRQ